MTTAVNRACLQDLPHLSNSCHPVFPMSVASNFWQAKVSEINISAVCKKKQEYCSKGNYGIQELNADPIVKNRRSTCMGTALKSYYVFCLSMLLLFFVDCCSLFFENRNKNVLTQKYEFNYQSTTSSSTCNYTTTTTTTIIIITINNHHPIIIIGSSSIISGTTVVTIIRNSIRNTNTITITLQADYPIDIINIVAIIINTTTSNKHNTSIIINSITASSIA